MRNKDTPSCDAYVGIDVSFAKGKYLPVCICVRQDERLVPLPLKKGPHPPLGRGNEMAVTRPECLDDFAKGARDYLEKIERQKGLRIVRIALDAPSSYRGEGRRLRAAEEVLSQENPPISFFKTPTRREFEEIKEEGRNHLRACEPVNRIPHANQLWMLAGFALFRELKQVAECIEVYPNAIARVLLGANAKPKSKSWSEQLAKSSGFTGWGQGGKPGLDAICWGASHDKVDAYLSAWIASLDESQREPLGCPPDDSIWVPRIKT